MVFTFWHKNQWAVNLCEKFMHCEYFVQTLRKTTTEHLVRF